jgi:hypothetical protein
MMRKPARRDRIVSPPTTPRLAGERISTMPRALNNKPCEVTFYDRISGSKITLYFGLPTTEERTTYINSMVTRVGNKIKNNTSEARQKWGLKILQGFKEGAFEKDDKVPVSSDPQSPHYDPEWKSLVKQFAADVIAMLAIHVFESSLNNAIPDEKEDAEEAETENP